MFRLLIERCDKPNPLTGRVQYRVLDSFEREGWFNKHIIQHPIFVIPRFSILSRREYKRGAYINPKKVLLESGK